jgi:hypothetical protein
MVSLIGGGAVQETVQCVHPSDDGKFRVHIALESVSHLIIHFNIPRINKRVPIILSFLLMHLR